MPPTLISFAESALGDLEAIRDWYAEQGVPEVGERLVAEVFDRIEALADHPGMGRVVPEFDQPFLRELIHPPFRIVYRRDRGRVRVVRIWRSGSGELRGGHCAGMGDRAREVVIRKGLEFRPPPQN